MEEYSVSIVRQSLVRTVVNGNMPSKWMWTNVLFCSLLGAFICYIFSFYISLAMILIGIIVHILLYKAFSYDEQFFSVYYQYLCMPDRLPATSRVFYSQDKFKGT